MTVERKRVRADIDNLYDGMPIDDVEQRLNDARKFAAENDYIALQLDIERDGYDDSVELKITGLRQENDKELERRLATDVARERQQREYYEELKRKFEGK